MPSDFPVFLPALLSFLLSDDLHLFRVPLVHIPSFFWNILSAVHDLSNALCPLLLSHAPRALPASAYSPSLFVCVHLLQAYD